MVTKLNVNIRTLLTRVEELSKDEANYWRLRKYIKSLDTMIEELADCDDIQSAAKIPEYTKRLEALKIITSYVDNSLPSNNRKPMGAESGDSILLEVRQLQDSKNNSDLRKELFNGDNLRQRVRAEENNATSGNMNEAVQFYSDAQEKITEHMLSLTRNLREQTETANRIIRRDTETVSRSSGMTDRNINSLNKETEKLADHSRNAWKCWMWLMIMFVIVTFIAMVLFMKIMKKKKA